MIAIILPLACTLALVGGAVGVNNDPSQAAAICAAHDSDGILIPHMDCSKFYKCWLGKPHVIDCPKPLLYNPEKEWCDWPDNVNCNRDPTETDVCDAEDSHGGLFPHEICSKFYMCINGKPFVHDCPPPLLYNIEMEHCDWPQNVICGNRT